MNEHPSLTTDTPAHPSSGSRRLVHDLRTPLNGIIGFAELIRDGKVGPVSDAQREFLGDILESARQLDRLITGAFQPPAAAAPAAGRAPATTEPEPAVTSQPGAPTILVVEDEAGDRAWLERTLSEAGYVVETAATGAEALARCRERAFDGITLDLLLPDMTGWDVLRGLRAEGLNRDVPTVVVSTTPQQVAVAGFVVRDVVAKPARAEELLAALEQAGVPPHGGRPVLVVDNNPGALRLADALLRVHGYRAVCRPDGESALRAAAEEPPAAVLLDLLMPGMDGFEFLDRFRQTPAGQRTPVIVWTIKDLTRDEHARLSTAAQAVIEKRHGGTGGLLEALQAHVAARKGGNRV
jgi:hypothetical protein